MWKPDTAMWNIIKQKLTESNSMAERIRGGAVCVGAEARQAQGKRKRIFTGLCGTQGRVLKPLVSTSVPLWSNGLA